MVVTRNHDCWPVCRQHRWRNVDSIEGGLSTGCRQHRRRVALIRRGMVYRQRECISHDNEYNTATPARQVISTGLCVYLLTSMSNEGRHRFYFEEDIKCSRTMVVLRNNLMDALLFEIIMSCIIVGVFGGSTACIIWEVSKFKLSGGGNRDQSTMMFWISFFLQDVKMCLMFWILFGIDV